MVQIGYDEDMSNYPVGARWRAVDEVTKDLTNDCATQLMCELFDRLSSWLAEDGRDVAEQVTQEGEK